MVRVGRGVGMHCLYAIGEQVAEIDRLAAEQGLADVTIKPPFLGKAVVWCGSERSRAIVAAKLEERQAA